MALRFKSNAKNRDFKSVPAGTHIAVCNLIADLGLQPPSDPHDEPKHQIFIRFEVLGERIEHSRDGQKYDDPMMISRTYHASMHGKATLRKDLEGWRGKRFTDEEADRFDIETILGEACTLSVVEVTKGDKTYSNIAAISGLPLGVDVPPAEMPLLLYDKDNPANFNQLPEWLQKKINEQIEEPVASDRTEITDDDIPF